MSVLFLLWLVTTNLVNFAFYLAITRVCFGWFKTVAVFVIGYYLPLVIYLIIHRMFVQINEIGMAWTFSYGFALMCTIWALNVLAMSRGPLGRRLFAILVAAGHQIGAFAFGFLAMRRIEPTWVGEVLAIATMALMGLVQVRHGIPRIHRMDGDAGWRELNLTAFFLCVSLYASGIWPVYVAAGDWRDIVRFLIANLVALFSAPLLLSFAEKNHALRLRRMLEDNTHILLADLRVARASEEGARRIRHDTRHHVEVLRTFLQEGRSDAALR